MVKKSFLLTAMVLAFSGQLLAGSILEMSGRNQDGPVLLMNRMYAQAGKFRMDHMDGKGGDPDKHDFPEQRDVHCQSPG